MANYKCDCGRTINDANNYCRCGKTKDQVKALDIAPVKCPECGGDIDDDECVECGESYDKEAVELIEKINNKYPFLKDTDIPKHITDSGYAQELLNADFFFIDYESELHVYDTEEKLCEELAGIASEGGDLDDLAAIVCKGKIMDATVGVVLSEAKDG